MRRWLITIALAAGLLAGGLSEGRRAEAWFVRNAGSSAYFEGDVDGALERYEKVSRLLSAEPRSHTDIADSFEDALKGQLGREMSPEELEAWAARAVRHYLEALRLGPPSAWSYTGISSLAQALRKARLTRGAVDLSLLSGDPLESLLPEDRLCEAALVKAVQIEPRNYYYRDFLGEFYLMRGFEERALAHFREAVRLQPVLDRHFYLARLASISPAVLAAVEDGIRDALESGKSSVPPYDIHRFMADVYLRMGRLPEARASLEEAARVSSAPQTALLRIGHILAQQGDDEGALESYRRAAESAPGYHRAWLNVGLTLSRLGRHDEAIAAAVRARGLNPTDYRTSSTLARVLETAGRLDEAAAVLEQVQRIDPDREQAQLQLIRIYERMGKLSQAVRVARRLAAKHPEEPMFQEQLEQLERAMAASP